MGEEDLIDATHALMALPKDVRDKHCKDVIMSILNTLEKINSIQGKILQMKALKAFTEDMKRKRSVIEPIILYTIKPEFRDFYLDLLDRIVIT